MNAKEFLVKMAAVASELRASAVLHEAAVGAAVLALLEKGEAVTLPSLRAEMERRMANPQQGDTLRPQDVAAGLKRLEACQEE